GIELVDNLSAARVVVWKRGYDLVAAFCEGSQRFKRGADLLACRFELGGHGVLAEQDDGPADVQTKAVHHFIWRRVHPCRDHVQSGKTHGKYTPWLLAETPDSVGCLLVRREVQVRELRHR